jgi:NAD+ diphosphatase
MKFCPNCGNEITLNVIDGVNRFACANKNCNFIHWDNPVPVVAALVKNQDKYIIARNVRWPKGIFSVITGYLESGEHPEDCVLREVQEELGLTGKIASFLGYHLFKEKNQLILAFEVVASGDLQTNHELSEWKYLTPVELSRYDFRPLYITEQIIKEWKKQQPMDFD